MRCSYCMPKEFFGSDYAFLERKELLTYEEITRVTRVFVRLGVRKVRITGGEPLLRRELSRLVSRLASVKGIEDLTLTTNGLLLKRHARDLKEAGLHRITVSLDSLDQEEFASIANLEAPVEEVLSGIREARRVGLTPVKINAVIRRGINEKAILELAAFFRGSGCVLRFIEYMDVGNTNAWQPSEVIPSREVLELIDSHYPLEPLNPNYTGKSLGDGLTATGRERLEWSLPYRSRFAGTAPEPACRRKEHYIPVFLRRSVTISEHHCAREPRTENCWSWCPASGSCAKTDTRS